MNTTNKLNHLLNQKKSHCDNACESQSSVLKNCFICHKSGHYAYECPEKRNRKKYRFLFKRDENLFKKKILKLIKNLNNFLKKGNCKKNKEVNLNYDVNSGKKEKFYFKNLIKLEEDSVKEIEKDVEERRNQRRKEFKRREFQREERRAQNLKPEICRDYIREKINNFRINCNLNLGENRKRYQRIKINNKNYFNEELEKLYDEKYSDLFEIFKDSIKINEVKDLVVENPEKPKVPLVDSKETTIIERGLVVDNSLLIKEETTRKKALQEENKNEKNKQENKEIKEESKEELKEERKEDKIKEILDKFSKFNENNKKKESDNLTVISSVSSLVSSTSNSSISQKEIEEYKKKSYNEKRKKLIELWKKEELDEKDFLKIYNLISSLMKYKKIFENEVESFKKSCRDNLNEIARELKG